MDRELFRKARSIYNELTTLEHDLENLRANANPSECLLIETKRYYGDSKSRAEFSDETATMLFSVITGKLEERIEQLKKQLEAL